MNLASAFKTYVFLSLAVSALVLSILINNFGLCMSGSVLKS